MLITFKSADTICSTNSCQLGINYKSESVRDSEASSPSLNLPGKNQVMDRRVDSNDEMVDTLFMRNCWELSGAHYVKVELADS